MAKSHPRNNDGGEEPFPSAARNNAKYDPEREVQKLRLQMQSLEAEFRHLVPVRNQLDQAYNQNRKLAEVLEASRGQIEALKEEVEKLTLPPNPYGFFSSCNDDGSINVYVSGRKMKVHVHPSIDPATLQLGQELVLNEAFNVVEVKGFQVQGEVVSIKDLLPDKRAIVALHADEERVVRISDRLYVEDGLHVGDHVLLDTRSGYLLERLPKSEAEELVIEEVPDIDYTRIGGLNKQIEEIRDAVELPFLYPELFREHQLDPPKGILLYGPPGCGKTLIAKAVANAIAKRVGEREGTDERARRSFFLHIKGPELLNKYVGESERKIREIFEKAKEKADKGVPVIIFFDEMDSLFRTRGSGVSSDMESTIVPQFLAEIDGVERLRNVIVIGATNRQDLIDPAVLRPGRLDVKIKVDRPDEDAARAIFAKYLTADLPLHPDAFEHKGEPAGDAVARMIDGVVEHMYADTEDNQFLEVTYANGEREICYFKDFASGAMIEGMVARAKKYAIKRAIEQNQKGIRVDDLLAAMRQEFRENEDLPNNTNPDDWAKIAGRKGERIANIRTITNEPGGEPKEITPVSAGHYL
ncbi:MAG: proteasome ATPase [Nitrospirae bacterium]|nr:proteasome ATPase [Nitrospirota bacterium]